jgi:CAAX protease family protein
MSGTMMDNEPLLPSSDEPEPRTAVDQQAREEPLSLVQVGRKGSWLSKVFVGPDGIYAVPRWLIYMAMAWVIFQIEVWLETSLHLHVSFLWSRLLIEANMMLAAILPGFVMARIEKRSFGDFGLPERHAFGRNFWVGTGWGIGSLTVLMLTLRWAGAFDFGTFFLHGARLWKFAAYYALLFLCTGFFEEFLMRGYSLWVLARGINFWPAAVLLSVAFGAIHGSNPGEAKAGLVAAGLIGFFLCLTLRRTGDLWWAVGFHTAWDWGESYLYSVPDSGALLPGHLLNSSLHGPIWISGGSVGPEGSYFVFILIGALWVLFDRAYPEAKYVVTPVPRSTVY